MILNCLLKKYNIMIKIIRYYAKNYQKLYHFEPNTFDLFRMGQFKGLYSYLTTCFQSLNISTFIVNRVFFIYYF